MIKIIDCGSQLTQNIARRIRELGVFAEILPFYTSPTDIFKDKPDGIIISGGQFSVHDENSPIYAPEILSTAVPVLGICFGQQAIAYHLGGQVVSARDREYGETEIVLENESPLFSGVKNKFQAWMSHGDIVEKPPHGFKITARSQNGFIAAMEKKNIFAVQFHPEVDHTEFGRIILDNFLKICNAQRIWNPEKEYECVMEETREMVRGKIGIGGISGGVDSTTLSVLLGKIAGDNYHPIFVDNGLLRMNEAAEVKSFLATFDLNVRYVDASVEFLEKLSGIADPDEKRKIIGHEFIRVFEEIAKGTPNVTYLAQGTLYPDVIESVPVYGSSSKIKRHHNVGGLPEKMNLEIVEPFRNMFKDEVRVIAEQKLGIHKEIVHRHPFPGPGLAVRIVGEITREKIELVRQADAIFLDELKRRNLYYKISQAFAVLTDIHSVGVMGDEGNYEGVIALRAITSNDFMTSDWFSFSKFDLTGIANRIINEVKCVNRVVYDITQKPPGTIEWE